MQLSEKSLSGSVRRLENSSINLYVEPSITSEFGEPIVRQANHTVLYDLSTLNKESPPKPYEEQNLNQQLSFVNLHCSRTKVEPRNSNSNKPHWPLITESLWKDFKNIGELEKAISQYCFDPSIIVGSFKALRKYCEQLDDKKKFFEKTLPAIIELALKLPNLVKTGIPLLNHGLNHSISLSQEQIACLLANAFLCTFHDKRNKDDTGLRFSDINFNGLFQSELDRVVEKIKCIVNYFERVIEDMPTGVLTFIRRSIGRDHLPDWSKTNLPISETFLRIWPNGKIEDDASGLLQVNFSNKYIGSKVLGNNCYQEEIRSSIFPELLISRLFTEYLKDNEALVVVGAEQFSNYIGYSDSFKFAENHCDNTPFDTDIKRRRCFIVAIDALDYSNPSTQYEKQFIKRELNKAYVGFYHPLNSFISTPPGVATGNWGCGAFKGDPQLKFLIQLMACTTTRRPLHYFTFQNTSLSDSLLDIYNYLKDNNMNTLQLWNYMNDYNLCKLKEENLFTFIKRQHRSGQKPFYKEQDDHEKNSKTFKFRRTQPETTPLPPQNGNQTYAQVANKEFPLTNKTSKYSYTAGAPIEQSHRRPTLQYGRDNIITNFPNDSQKSNQTYGEIKNIDYPSLTNDIRKTTYSAGAPMEQSHRRPTLQYGRDNIITNFPNDSQKSNQTYGEVKNIDYPSLTNDIRKTTYSAGAPMEQSHRRPTLQYGRDNIITNFPNDSQKSNQAYGEVKNKEFSLTNKISKNSYTAGAPMEQFHRRPTLQYGKDNIITNFPNDSQKSNQTYGEVKNIDYPSLTNDIRKTTYSAGAPMEQSHRRPTLQYGRDNIITNFPNDSQKSNQTYGEVKNIDYPSLTNDIRKTTYSAGAPMEQTLRTPTSQYGRDNIITNFPNDSQKSNQTYGEVKNIDYPLLTNDIRKTTYSAGAPMEQSHRTPTHYERDNKTNLSIQINSFQNNLQDEDVLIEECENNTIANNQKVKESYNKPSNSSISRDYSESEKKSFREIFELYQTADKNKAKKTSSSHEFHLRNLENDYSTTNGEYGNKPISTNQKKYIQQNSNITNEESASGSSVYFNRNQGNNNFNSGLNNKLSKKDKVEVDIHTEMAEEIMEYGWVLP